jgi:hypothetical protein
MSTAFSATPDELTLRALELLAKFRKVRKETNELLARSNLLKPVASQRDILSSISTRPISATPDDGVAVNAADGDILYERGSEFGPSLSVGLVAYALK